MSVSIYEIPADELMQDRTDSVADIDICNRAMAYGVMTHRDGFSVMKRRDINYQIIEAIDAELDRRAKTTGGDA